MATRRLRTKSTPPRDEHQGQAAPEPFDVTAWARRAVSVLPDGLPDDERAVLDSQLRSLASAATAAAPLPPDPTALRTVRDPRALKEVAARLAAAAEVAVDLETSSLRPAARAPR
jgi:hypothetical protein